jgi:hypothetical protein
MSRSGLVIDRQTPVVRVLLELRSASIRVIAHHAGLTHSAASQTVALTKAGLVRSQVGKDSRERVISLSPRAVSMVPQLNTLALVGDHV